MQSVFLQKRIHLFPCLAVQFGICVLHRVKDKRQGYHVKARIESRIDQIGVHGDLYRVSVHQGLDTLGLVAVGKLVSRVYFYVYFAACGFLHELSELFPGLCPGTGLRGGAGKIPGLLFPAQITVVTDLIVILRTVVPGCTVCMICQLGGSRIGASGKNLGQAHRYLGDIGDHQQHHYTRCDHGHNCPGYLLQADFQSLFDLNTDGDKQIDTHRRRYLPDRQVDGCQNTEGHQVISQRLADRQHNGNKYVHGGVGINKASRDQEDHIHDQKENELIVGNTS